MTSITISDLLTTIFVLIDDWYQAEVLKLLHGKPGKKPEFRDSEVMILMLAQDYVPYPSETQYVEFIRANYLDLYPKLVDQNQFNRRVRALRLPVEPLRPYWIAQKGWNCQTRYLLDTKPVPVLGCRRNKSHSDFLGSCQLGRLCQPETQVFWLQIGPRDHLERHSHGLRSCCCQPECPFGG